MSWWTAVVSWWDRVVSSWRAAEHLGRCDWQGVPNGMYVMAARGMTSAILWNRMVGVPWSEKVIKTAALHGHLRTVIWLQLFGCPWRLDDVAGIEDTSVLRWLLQYKHPEDSSIWMAASEGSLPSLLVFLRFPFDPRDHVSRWYVSESREHARWSDRRHFACVALMAKYGFMPFPNQEGLWRAAVRRLRFLESVPEAAARFAQRRQAVLTVQSWWLKEYYTPGRPLWLRRMHRQFRCLPQLPGSCRAVMISRM